MGKSYTKIGRKIKEKKGITAHFIKYMCVVNAFGNTSNPVFLITDDKMSEIDFDVHQVNGLGTTTAVSSKGYVGICKSRVGNDKFFTWFNRTVMEFLDEIRSF